MVVEGEAPFLRQFDDHGKIIWQGGIKGKGPGEYLSIGRVVFLTSGGITIVDDSGMRVTALSAAHALQSTTSLTAYATTAAANTDGTILLGAESPTGRFSLTKFRDGAPTKLVLPISVTSPADGPYKGASIAIGPNGKIAIMPSNERYEILRMDSSARRNRLSPEQSKDPANRPPRSRESVRGCKRWWRKWAANLGVQ